MDAAAEAAAPYQRHAPEQELLYQVLAENLATFLQQARTADHALPAYVERDLRAYLDCGVLACGFLRRRCPDCNESRIVPFSCKRRTFCPRCLGRRMADTAARLVDQVFPAVPVRQWVLSFPIEIRYRLAYDGALLSAVLGTFLEHLRAFYRAQAQRRGYRDGRTGGVTFVQRFGSALNLTPHLHVLMLDGVYVRHPDSGQPTFVAVDPPSDAQVQHLIEQVAGRLIARLERRGVLDDGQADALVDQAPLLAGLAAASVQGRLALGPHAGQRLRRVLADPGRGQRTAPLCFAARGFSLHAATTVAARDRAGRERLCRYVNRPPLAYAALVPPPRLHLVRYHGVLAPHAADRALIVPGAPAANGPSDTGPTAAAPARGSRLPWAWLLARVFAVDALRCPRCGGRLRLIAALTDPDSMRTYLTGVGLPADPPALAPPRPPPSLHLFP